MSGPKVREGTLAKIYAKHLKNVQTAKAKVDDSPPRLPLSIYIKDASYYADIARLRHLGNQNRELLKRINIVYRTKGRVDCGLQTYKRHKTIYSHKYEALELERKRNVKFLETLDPKLMQSQYNRADCQKHWKKMQKVMKFGARYPEFYDKKPSPLDTWTLCPPGVATDTSSHQVCYLDLKIGDLPRTSRLDIEIYSDIVPATAANFLNLCHGFGELSYKGSPFHRINPGLLCIGGDIINHSGSSGMSIYGPSFPDENFTLQHNGPGVVAMYSSQANSNNSKFLITFTKLVTLNGKYVVIGRVRSNYNVLKMIESCGTKGGKPLQTVKVVKCGVYGQLKRKNLPSQVKVIDMDDTEITNGLFIKNNLA